MSDIA